jgi:hypothetical protein
MGRNRTCTKRQIKIAIFTPEITVIVGRQLVELCASSERVLKLFDKWACPVSEQKNATFRHEFVCALLSVKRRKLGIYLIICEKIIE